MLRNQSEVYDAGALPNVEAGVIGAMTTLGVRSIVAALMALVSARRRESFVDHETGNEKKSAELSSVGSSIPASPYSVSAIDVACPCNCFVLSFPPHVPLPSP